MFSPSFPNPGLMPIILISFLSKSDSIVQHSWMWQVDRVQNRWYKDDIISVDNSQRLPHFGNCSYLSCPNLDYCILLWHRTLPWTFINENSSLFKHTFIFRNIFCIGFWFKISRQLELSRTEVEKASMDRPLYLLRRYKNILDNQPTMIKYFTRNFPRCESVK